MTVRRGHAPNVCHPPTSVDPANFPGVAAKAAETQVVVVAPGSRVEAPTLSMVDLGNAEFQHASSLSPAYGNNRR